MIRRIEMKELIFVFDKVQPKNLKAKPNLSAIEIIKNPLFANITVSLF